MSHPLSVLDFQHVAPYYRPWLVLFEAGWSVQKIADTWSTNEKPLTAEHVQTILDDISLAPYSPPSAQALLQRKVDRVAEITVKDFQRLTKERGWSEDWIVSQCGDELDHPTQIVHEMLEGKARPRLGFHRFPRI